MLMLGNLLKVSGVVDRLSKSAQNEIINIATLFLGLTIGATMMGASFANLQTLLILVLGVLASFTFQVIYNITMSAGLAPVKGLTLPLMSYGGSSMIATLAAFGLIINVRMRRFTN